MIYHLLYPLSEYFFPFNLTRYITFRGGCAFMLSFVLVLLFWRFTIRHLKRMQITEHIDMYGNVHLESLYEGKKGTPTMGGLLILFSVLVTTLLCARLDNYLIWIGIFVMVSLGAVGLADDFIKIKRRKGLSRTTKLLLQGLIGIILGALVVVHKDLPSTLGVPFFKKFALDLGYFYVFWAALIIAATSNAVNFTDGLDGLAIGGIITNSFIFGLLSYLVGHVKFADYLFIPFVPGAGELAILCFALVGSCLGFLWFNCYPAGVFMGDVGALSLGGVIGAVALLIKKEFLLFIAGGLFVLEAVSVILQMASVRLRGKRLFRAAPFHHHLQLLGWKEPKIIVRLWIVSALCALIALLTLKLR
ncbi:MAG: phospho-N-acetylmuramoyl-pentapeptide-transferase [Candidatus Omnitrophota bacterium]|nr:MAG: phospho-N-acetylmuramoyl-pentapeptide-transferase [Candidatus Omnitrophota bacterium]